MVFHATPPRSISPRKLRLKHRAWWHAYSMIFMPDYGEKSQMLRHLTEAKRWFGEIPGKDHAAWQYFLESDGLKVVLAGDPMFQPLLATNEKPKE